MESPIGKMFKKSPLLVKEHNRNACKYLSYVKFPPKETYSVSRATELREI